MGKVWKILIGGFLWSIGLFMVVTGVVRAKDIVKHEAILVVKSDPPSKPADKSTDKTDPAKQAHPLMAQHEVNLLHVKVQNKEVMKSYWNGMMSTGWYQFIDADGIITTVQFCRASEGEYGDVVELDPHGYYAQIVFEELDRAAASDCSYFERAVVDKGATW